MIIKIKAEGKKIFFAIPISWAFSRVGLYFLNKYNPDGTFNGITVKSMRNIRKTLRRMRKKYRNWNLVEVESSEGDSVIIKM
jgi:hypothetical protein